MTPAAAAVACSLAAVACGRPTTPALPGDLAPGSLTLAGEFNIPPLGRFPPVVGLPFGGLSGLAPLGGSEWLAVCDEREGSRVYRLRISGEGTRLRVTPQDVVGLQTGGAAPPVLDAEGIALTPEGTMVVSSEGAGNEQPRVPPALVEYDLDGRFIRQYEVRAHHVPNAAGPLTQGARSNAALESLTIAADGRRLFTALESPLVQDGEPAGLGRGATTRILEYVRVAGTYAPARELAYPLEPVDPPRFEVGGATSGLVELLALEGGDLLALERTYLRGRAAAGGRPPSLNRIRLYRVSLAGATDVSGMESLAGATFTPVRKALLLDLSAVQGLSPELHTLENFEGLAAGPALADGSRSLLLVSDDNFGDSQRTSFLLFRIAGGK